MTNEQIAAIRAGGVAFLTEELLEALCDLAERVGPLRAEVAEVSEEVRALRGMRRKIEEALGSVGPKAPLHVRAAHTIGLAPLWARRIVGARPNKVQVVEVFGASPYAVSCWENGRKLVDPFAERSVLGKRLAGPDMPPGDTLEGRLPDGTRGPTWPMSDLKPAVAWLCEGVEVAGE